MLKFTFGRILNLNNAEIASYASGIDARRFPYFCAETGELAESLRYVIRETIRDLLYHGFLHRWKRTRSWQ